MNMVKASSVAHAVRTRILRANDDRLWTYADFPVGSRLATSAALSRMARSGMVTRIRRGVYYRSRGTIAGRSRPNPEAVIDTVLRLRGATSIPSGIGEYNRLGLTTQVSGSITRAVSRPMNRRVVGGVSVYLNTRPLEKQKGIRPEERTALDALRDIARIPGSSPREVIERIGRLIHTGELEFSRLARYAVAEPPRVRALLGAIGDNLRSEGSLDVDVVRAHDLAVLRSSLNPLSHYRIRGVRDFLGSAASWRIH